MGFTDMYQSSARSCKALPQPALTVGTNKSASCSALFQNRKLKFRDSQGKAGCSRSPLTSWLVHGHGRGQPVHSVCASRRVPWTELDPVLCDLGQVLSLPLSPVSSPSPIITKPLFRLQIGNLGPLFFVFCSSPPNPRVVGSLRVSLPRSPR